MASRKGPWVTDLVDTGKERDTSEENGIAEKVEPELSGEADIGLDIIP